MGPGGGAAGVEARNHRNDVLLSLSHTSRAMRVKNELICETETDSDVENKSVVAKGEEV